MLKKIWVEKGFLSAFLLISFFQLLREMVCFLRAGHIYVCMYVCMYVYKYSVDTIVVDVLTT